LRDCERLAKIFEEQDVRILVAAITFCEAASRVEGGVNCEKNPTLNDRALRVGDLGCSGFAAKESDDLARDIAGVGF
jgi:hypothetical protein